jgi:hypothetical protein
LTLKEEEWGQWPQWFVVEEGYGEVIGNIDGEEFVRRKVFPNGAVTSGVTWNIYEAASGGPNLRPDNVREIKQ